ncbi:acyclic terpene utilization AtuA family protein [Variovorax sp. J22P168]|uniref:acyclic terpene utilization AtuA family protein n=1 Tax=Variovorax jilinensis TaxID=3053513 RepID=UPI002575E02A|nr:acyclic terpene utilization AtuA family protein [Variovorax sp. J22P168]MDM0014565.1 acyclic terpene utilization AtuA family protein [Variovorax sp. J22P168]
MNEELRIVALNGCLGYGFEVESLQRGVDARPHMFGADAGSTDAGPYYLGSGTSMVRREQVQRDLSFALAAARGAGVPLVIGSAGIAGGEPNLQAVREVLLETAHAQGLHFKLATIHAEIDRSAVLDALHGGGIEPMPGVAALTEADVHDSVRIVGQMGCEPFAEALAAGADVVLAGRACDTAIYAALPISRGFDPGLALHLAKIMECGAQCAVPQGTNDCLLGTLRRDHFLVRPLAGRRVCTPESVAAHTMYEQGDPLMLHEPEGRVDLCEAEFEQVDAQTVRVSGSRFLPTPGLQIKLEGARSAGFRAFALAGIRDATIIGQLDTIEATVRDAVRRNLGAGVADADWQIDFKVYGRDAVLGAREPLRHRPAHEVGVLLEVVARTQALASHALSLARSSFLHCPFPGRKTTAGNLAFPFSPSDTAAGEVFEFSVYHLMRVADQRALFAIDMERV